MGACVGVCLLLYICGEVLRSATVRIRDGVCIVGAQRIALYHTASGFFATGNTCPHRGGPLGEGDIIGDEIVCPWHLWAFDIATGFCGGLGHILLTESYRRAAASLIAPFDYTSMLWTLLLGFVFLSEIPSLLVLAGVAVIAAAGLLVIWRERQLGAKRRIGNRE